MLRRVILLGSRAPTGPPPPGPEPDPEALVETEPDQPGDQADPGVFNPDRPLEQLLPLTAHHDPQMRSAALEALTLHAADERARRAVIDHLSDPDTEVRAIVVGLLGIFLTEWPGAEAALVQALRDPAVPVRHLALHTLWEVSAPAAADALPVALSDEDAGIRAFALQLLRQGPGHAEEESDSSQEAVPEPEEP